MDIKHLHAFLMVAETGNVTRAADMLHLVQPAVSRQIRLLEDDVGTALFERQRHGMVLTDAGKALVGYARRVVLELDRARMEISGAATGSVSGLVTLGLLPSTVDLLSSPLVAAIADAHPGIRLRIAVGYAGTLLQWLQSGEVDAALLYGAERSSEIESTPLIEEALWVIGPPDSALSPDRPVALAELSRHRMVLPSAPHGIRTLVEHASAVAKVDLNLSAETNDLSVQRSLVLCGHGLTILPPIAVAEDLRNHKLKGAPLTEPGISRSIVLALPMHRPTARHVRCAVDLLLRETHNAINAGAWPEGRWLGS
ncbi:LysR family transcriptional regulator [Alcaligenaceae bacterium]|nr:LysR family transcriptional regulator [Alcaligenaceae bacterium]